MKIHIPTTKTTLGELVNFLLIMNGVNDDADDDAKGWFYHD